MNDGDSGTNRLCEDCQRPCKQTRLVIVCNCPHYVRLPRQGELLDRRAQPKSSLVSKQK